MPSPQDRRSASPQRPVSPCTPLQSFNSRPMPNWSPVRSLIAGNPSGYLCAPCFQDDSELIQFAPQKCCSAMPSCFPPTSPHTPLPYPSARPMPSCFPPSSPEEKYPNITPGTNIIPQSPSGYLCSPCSQDGSEPVQFSPPQGCLPSLNTPLGYTSGLYPLPTKGSVRRIPTSPLGTTPLHEESARGRRQSPNGSEKRPFSLLKTPELSLLQSASPPRFVGGIHVEKPCSSQNAVRSIPHQDPSSFASMYPTTSDLQEMDSHSFTEEMREMLLYVMQSGVSEVDFRGYQMLGLKNSRSWKRTTDICVTIGKTITSNLSNC